MKTAIPASTFQNDSNNLNVLRSLAVLFVFVSHVLQLSYPIRGRWQLGRVGVLLFFIHTTLVLMQSLERQEKAKPGNMWARFMIRRCFRIYPLSIVAVLVYVGLGIPEIQALHQTFFRHLTRSGLLANLLLVQNVSGSPSVPWVLWSLPYEMQMYCVLPALYLAAKSGGISKLSKIFTVSLAYAFLVQILLPLRFYWLFEFIPNQLLSLLQFVPCFVMGAIAYKIPRSNRVTSWMWPLFVCGAVLAFALFANRDIWFQWALCGVVGLALPHFRDLPNNFLTKAARYIAKFSYGIYLFHGAAVWFAIERLGFRPVSAGIICLAVIVPFAALAYYAIEKPFMDCGGRLRMPVLRRSPGRRVKSVPLATVASRTKSANQIGSSRSSATVCSGVTVVNP